MNELIVQYNKEKEEEWEGRGEQEECRQRRGGREERKGELFRFQGQKTNPQFA